MAHDVDKKASATPANAPRSAAVDAFIAQVETAPRPASSAAGRLIFYRGFGECKASKWYTNSDALLKAMTGVTCLGGQTQIGKVLKHAREEAAIQKVGALVFVGDAFEEDIDQVCHRAGELGLAGVPAVMFHEGPNPIAANAFKQIAKLTGGAYCPFDEASAAQLAELLRAVAVFAAGGHKALADYSGGKGAGVKRLAAAVKALPGR